MIFLKLQGLLVLTALLSFMSPSETKVVNSMTACHQFFLNQTPPNIQGILMNGKNQNQNRYKPICQTFNNTVTFVTLYDITNKIPVFSAYKYEGDDGGERPTTWMIEPQLDFPNGNNNKELAGKLKFTNQAVEGDYENKQNYDKGHLLPNSYGLDDTVRRSTFTLTNAAPQNDTFNRGRWRTMEGRVKQLLNNDCINNNNQTEGFVVIGAQPSKSTFLNNKINIPSLLWSAFCCCSSTQGKWLAGAYWGENVGNTPNNTDMYDFMTLEDLYNLMGGGFNVFPGSLCPLNNKSKSSCKRPRPP